MTSQDPQPKLRVLIAGAGAAGLESVLALAQLAPGLTHTTVLAPNTDYVERPTAVREPFSYAAARRFALAPIVADAGAELLTDTLAWVDSTRHVLHTGGGRELGYDVLVLALGGRICPRYAHAITIDDRKLDSTLEGLILDVEGGYVDSVAFVAPGRMAWPLPLYELALMLSARAYDMNVDLSTTIVTPEDSPLAIFGSLASKAVAQLLEDARIATITSAYAEVPRHGEIVIHPGDRRLTVDRVVALPELFGPSIRGVPLSEHGFLRVNRYGRHVDVQDVYAAGDAVDFPVKHGGIACQQADVVARAIAARAGAPVQPEPFEPVIRGMLLTGEKPRYLSARLAGGHGFSSEISDQPTWSPPSKIASRYLAPYLEQHAGALLG